MKTILLAAALLLGLLGMHASAQTRVGGWEIEKRQQDEHCNATRAYKDADDEDRQNVIVLSYSKEAIVIVLVYEGWEWDKKDDILMADLATDKATIMKRAKWQVMDKTTLRGIFEFNQSTLEALGRAKSLKINFEDDDDDDSTDFDIARAPEAVAALKFCEENKGGAATAPQEKSSPDRE